jgi:hypothetical protein
LRRAGRRLFRPGGLTALPRDAAAAARVRTRARSALEQVAAAIAGRTAVEPQRRAREGLARASSTLAGRAAAPARLTSGARAALNEISAAVTCRAASDVLGGAGLRLALVGQRLTALTWNATAAARSITARSTLDFVSAAVARRATPDVLDGARFGHARAGVRLPALAGDTGPAARLARWTWAALNDVPATVAGWATREIFLCARERLARSAVRLAALASHAATAAREWAHARSAVDLVAASVTRGPAGDALRGARLRLAAAAVGIAAVPEYAAAAARLRRGAGAAAELIAAAVAGRPAGDPL